MHSRGAIAFEKADHIIIILNINTLRHKTNNKPKRLLLGPLRITTLN